MAKQYDAVYFERWYRDPARRTARRPATQRKVALAVASAEFHLGRPLRSVLDVGCGEGDWRAPLLRLRPRCRYLGLDPSPHAIARHGRRRNLRPARFADLEHLRFDAAFDLLVCADLMHYLPAAELRAGLRGFSELCHGVAFLETYCRGDDIEGDLEGFHARPAGWYRRRFSEAGLRALGSHCWLSPALQAGLPALESCP
ncbi:MAG TPA: class I SAM-dependent methyltransferase [Xanthomonadaceae bacterium]|nr:class I SAM-dependent methyltransferase [Xanthomonadaceae bacterium]